VNGLDRLLVNFLGRDQQRYIATADHQFVGNGHARKEMAARAAARDPHQRFRR
jgi:hypothetical protein